MASIQIDKKTVNQTIKMAHTSPLQETAQSAVELSTKLTTVFGLIATGLIGKFGWDIVNKKKLTFKYIFGSSCMAVFVGFVTWQFIKSNPSINPGIVLPLASLLSRDIILFLTMIDWQGVLKLLTGKSTLKEKETDTK